jgi:hypothetical protein
MSAGSSTAPLCCQVARGAVVRTTLGPAWLLLALSLVLLAPRVAGAEDLSTARFAGIVQAWQAESAPSVAAAMAYRGRLTLDLRVPRVAGSYAAPQAQRTLHAYFQKVSGIGLKDVTSRRHQDAPGYRTRFYEYSYQPVGRDPVKAVLVITLKAGAEATWHLVSIEERPLRTPRR